MEQYGNELETFDELQHLATIGMKPPYRFGTHKDDPLAQEYRKLNPQVVVIASSLMNGQREGHHFLSQHHANLVSRTYPCIYNLRDVVDIDGSGKTAPLPYELMRTAPATSFDGSGTPGRAPRYQWYARIEVAYQNSRTVLADWRKCDEELD